MARRKRGRPVDGWLILDKPVGLGSTKAVSIVKRLFDAQKAGHGGTLDPLASGLLPIAFGEATKTVQFVMDGTKTYRFTVKWGEETNTDDAEGGVVETRDVRPDAQAIIGILGDFTGVIEQVPPQFSALKVGGERAYDLAREGHEVKLAAREVEIDALRLVECPERDHAVFEVECGKGTYVRALARDMGRRLGCLGHISALRRVAVGPFDESDMISLEKLHDLRHKGAGPEGLDEVLCSVETALDDIPALAIDGTQAARLKQGQSVILRGRDPPIAEDPVLVTWRGSPVAIARIEGGILRSTRVFNLSNGR
jgi:tRNA pseudouridine55 synthase